jgi:hypothetical protein
VPVSIRAHATPFGFGGRFRRTAASQPGPDGASKWFEDQANTRPVCGSAGKGLDEQDVGGGRV